MAGIESTLPAATTQQAAASGLKTNKGQDQQNQFLQLLVAQLKQFLARRKLSGIHGY